MERDFDDVKLAGERPSEQIRAARAADDKWEIHRQNGNIVRAQKIGATLGGFAAGVKTKKDDETRESSREESLRPALTAFACVAAIESELPDKLLIRVALNVFYDVVKKENPRMYDRMGSSGAFTFFYLAWRKPGDACGHVADTFAMLAGKQGDAGYLASVRKSFQRDCARAKGVVNAVKFE